MVKVKSPANVQRKNGSAITKHSCKPDIVAGYQQYHVAKLVSKKKIVDMANDPRANPPNRFAISAAEWPFARADCRTAPKPTANANDAYTAIEICHSQLPNATLEANMVTEIASNATTQLRKRNPLIRAKAAIGLKFG